MKFEWDENKNLSNIEKHGIDFNDAIYIFDKQIISKEDIRKDYKEKRWIAIGLLNEHIVVIIYTIRNKSIRIISVRLANRNEKNRYYETFK